MRVLLLHPEDPFPASTSCGDWGMVVDLGRAPISTYEAWARQAGCKVLSIFDLAREMEDLRDLRPILSAGMGQMLDHVGIDWWDVLSLMIAPDLLNLVLVRRLTALIPSGSDLYVTRPDAKADALHRFIGGRLNLLKLRGRPGRRGLSHYAGRFARLDRARIVQIAHDKFDPVHLMRRRFSGKARITGSVVLLPSAYINVSRSEVAYASLMPEKQFLLVCARGVAKLGKLPKNVNQVSLDGYFVPADKQEESSLLQAWQLLRLQLLESGVFDPADNEGWSARIPSLLRWGLAIRGAWNEVFASHDVAGCLSADDSNPYTRIPLLLARSRGVPALACHHGALDGWMAAKTHHEDVYLAKGEMEFDYLVEQCRMQPDRIFVGAPPSILSRVNANEQRSWLVFFTEPYLSSAWRNDEVYRDLLPKLVELAKDCGLELVFKIHAFETVKGTRRMLSQLLGPANRNIRVIEGPISEKLLSKTRFALTAESSVAVEAARLAVPIFLCGWLRDSYCGYMRQYARFGVGRLLETSDQITQIPNLLDSYGATAAPERLNRPIAPEELRQLLSITSTRRAVADA